MRAAEENLKRAERARSDAMLATTNSVTEAGKATRAAVDSYQAQKQFDATIARGFDASLKAVDVTAANLNTLREERSLDEACGDVRVRLSKAVDEAGRRRGQVVRGRVLCPEL